MVDVDGFAAVNELSAADEVRGADKDAAPEEVDASDTSAVADALNQC